MRRVVPLAVMHVANLRGNIAPLFVALKLLNFLIYVDLTSGHIPTMKMAPVRSSIKSLDL
jgi:hypothetical protein